MRLSLAMESDGGQYCSDYRLIINWLAYCLEPLEFTRHPHALLFMEKWQMRKKKVRFARV